MITLNEIEGQARGLACRIGLKYQSERWEAAVQDAILAGWEASQRDNGTGVRAYVYQHMRGAILHYIQRFESNYGHETPLSSIMPVTEGYEPDSIEIDADGQLSLSTSEQRELPSVESHTPDSELIERERNAAVHEAIESLPDRDKAILEARMNGDTLDMIGERFGITKGRVSQIESEIYDQLRPRLLAYA